MERRILLNKNRDFSLIFGESSSFLRENFRQLMICLVVIAVPIYTFTTVFTSYQAVRTATRSVSRGFYSSSSQVGIFDPGVILLVFFLSLVTYLFALGAVFGYMKLYNSPHQEAIKPGQVWKAISMRLLKAIVFTIISLVGVAFLLFIYSFISKGLVQINENLNSIVTIFFLLNIMSFYSIYWPVLFFEDESFFDSLGRTFEMWSKKYWRTILVNFIAAYIVGVFILALYLLFFQLPQFLFETAFNRLTSSARLSYYLVATTITAMAGFIFYIYYYLVVAMQYFGLLESTSHTGLKARIEKLGAETDRPEEEY